MKLFQLGVLVILYICFKTTVEVNSASESSDAVYQSNCVPEIPCGLEPFESNKTTQTPRDSISKLFQD